MMGSISRRRTERLRRKHIDEVLREFERGRHVTVPAPGWLREVRLALGIPTGWLARKLNVTPGAISHLESREAEGAVTLASLREAADAMDCDVIYAVVPRAGTVSEALERRAEQIARETLARVTHTMALEDQKTSSETVEEEIREIVRDLLSHPRALWT